jgi:hypothetical protein
MRAEFVALVLCVERKDGGDGIVPLAYVPDSADAETLVRGWTSFNALTALHQREGRFARDLSPHHPGKLLWMTFAIVGPGVDANNDETGIVDVVFDELEERQLRADWRPA